MASLQPEQLNFAELQAPTQWVRGPRGMARLADDLAKVPHFAIDTETGGVAQLKEPLNARLSLIQLFIPRRDRWGNISNTEGRLVVIDVLRLEQLAAQRGTDHAILEPLREVLANPTIKKVIHHEAFERDQFARRKLSIEGVIDTESLARKVRTDLVSYSLGAVDFELRQVALDKGLQDSDWLKRPISEEQKRYAALDPQETFHVWQALRQIEQAVSIDCEASLQSYCSELSSTRQAHAQLLETNNLNILCPRIERAIELTREMIKIAALRIYNERSNRTESLTIPSSYGSVVIGPHQSHKIDLDKLALLHPQVAQEVIKSTCTQDELSKALRAAGNDAKQTKQIINSLYCVKKTAIKAQVEQTEVGSDMGDQALLETFGISSDQAPQQLIQKLVLLSGQILALKRQAGIANQLAVFERRAELLAQLIETEVEALAIKNSELTRLECEQIEITIKRATKRELDAPRFSAEYPEISEAVLRPSANQKELRAAFATRGLDESEIEALVSECLYLSPGTGQAGVAIYPHYSIIYQFSRPQELRQQLAL